MPVGKIRVGERFRKELGDLDDLIESIKAKGLIQPITVDAKYNLLAGGRRLAACQKAGLLEIPCIRRNTSGAVDAIEIELFENIHRKDFTWQERCAAEKALLELKKKSDPEWGIRKQARETDVSAPSVLRRIELAQAVEQFPELGQMENEDQAWKAYKRIEEKLLVESLISNAKSKALKGVAIAEKNYRLGDVLSGMETLRDSEYHFAEVDPPYAIDIDIRKSRAKETSRLDTYEELSKKDYPVFIDNLAREVFRVLQPSAYAIWWFGMDWYNDTLAILREAGFTVSTIPAIWTKGAQGQTASPDTMLGSSYEPFFVCRKGNGKLAKAGRSNVFNYTPLAPAKKIHPTEKPLDLMVDILETFTFPGTRMVIPLLGSGVTLRACYKTGRIGFGWDLSKEHRKRFLARVAEEEEAGVYGEKAKV